MVNFVYCVTIKSEKQRAGRHTQSFNMKHLFDMESSDDTTHRGCAHALTTAQSGLHIKTSAELRGCEQEPYAI